MSLNAALEVRSFDGRHEYEQMVDYFLGANDAFLQGMGVARSKLPSRDEWIRAALHDETRPNDKKERAYLAWVRHGMAIGHSSINKIRFGEEAFVHLHLWDAARRRSGLGLMFFQLSVRRFARDFALKRLYCEPYAANPGPNRVLTKSGFRFLKQYRTVPGPLNFEQDVNQYVRDFTASATG